ncbi:peroxisome biogenesis factor 10 [Tulasnella sp. JGI-2019a]|nr:peroxisome biogenesis factor 10 [Tulasnella sp. JGI-2019a]
MQYADSRSQSHSNLYAQWDAVLHSPLGEDVPTIDQDKEQQCQLCLEPPTQPCCLTRCGHVYCSTCIRQWLDFSPKCYACKTSATTAHIIPLIAPKPSNRGGILGYFAGTDGPTTVAASTTRDRCTLSPFSSSSSSSSPSASSAVSSLPSSSSTRAKPYISLPPTHLQRQSRGHPLSPPDTTLSSPSSVPSELGLSFPPPRSQGRVSSGGDGLLLPPPRIKFYKHDDEAAASPSSSTPRYVIQPGRGESHVFQEEYDYGDDGNGADDEHDEENGWDTDEELDLQLNQLAIWQEQGTELSLKRRQASSLAAAGSAAASDPANGEKYPVQSRVLSVVGLALMLAVLLK